MLFELGFPPLAAMTFAAVLALSLLELRRNQRAQKERTQSKLGRRSKHRR